MAQMVVWIWYSLAEKVKEADIRNDTNNYLGTKYFNLLRLNIKICDYLESLVSQQVTDEINGFKFSFSF